MSKCLFYSVEHARCKGLNEFPTCRCGGVSSRCDFYPEPWKQKPTAMLPKAELIKICREAREACFARRCGSCKYAIAGFPRCQDHFYAAKLTEHADQIIELLKEEKPDA